MLDSNNTTILKETGLCEQRIVKASIDKNIIEGIVWMIIAVVSFFLNAYALQSLTKKLKFKRTHRLYLGNVFLCNLTMGSLVYICFMLMKFDCQPCALRDTFFVGVVFYTNVNQLSMICILTCHMANCTQKLWGSTVSRVVHILAVVISWMFSVIIVLIMVKEPGNNGVLVFTFCKTLCIFILGICAIRYIHKGIQLMKTSDTQRRYDTTLSNTAIKIMTAFIMITVLTWFPLLTMIALQNFKVVSTHELALPLMIATRFVCLGPVIDPLFYFWSKKVNRVSIVREQ